MSQIQGQHEETEMQIIGNDEEINKFSVSKDVKNCLESLPSNNTIALGVLAEELHRVQRNHHWKSSSNTPNQFNTTNEDAHSQMLMQMLLKFKKDTFVFDEKHFNQLCDRTLNQHHSKRNMNDIIAIALQSIEMGVWSQFYPHHMNTQQIVNLMIRAQFIRMEPLQCPIRRGDIATHFYIIVNGNVNVIALNHSRRESRVIRQLNRSHYFGEEIVNRQSHDMYRTTVKVCDDDRTGASFLMIPNDLFQSTFRTVFDAHQRDMYRMLMRCPSLRCLPRMILRQFASWAQEKHHQRDCVLIQQGDPSVDCMYFIRSGIVRVVKEIEKPQIHTKSSLVPHTASSKIRHCTHKLDEIQRIQAIHRYMRKIKHSQSGFYQKLCNPIVVECCELGQFCFFGERSVLEGIPRTASIISKTSVKLIEIASVEILELLNQQTKMLFQKHIDSYPSHNELWASTWEDAAWIAYKEYVCKRSSKYKGDHGILDVRFPICNVDAHILIYVNISFLILRLIGMVDQMDWCDN